jgi:hypothetical protein
MDQPLPKITSSQFRNRYAYLRDPSLVTVNGHPLGIWVPADHPFARRYRDLGNAWRLEETGQDWGGPDIVRSLNQGQRDAILRKMATKPTR